MELQLGISQPLPLVAPTHSLKPDMINGWRPQNWEEKSPIYLDFELEFPLTLNIYTGKLNQPIYNGPRPRDSYSFHKKLSAIADYVFDTNDPLMSTFEYQSEQYAAAESPRFFRGMKSKINPDLLHFDSDFECGNLDQVLVVNMNEYDLYMRIDSNTQRHLHWFYFKVTNIGFQRKVRFNIINFSRHSPLYNHGLKPAIYSKKRIENNLSEGWERGGTHLKFVPSKINRRIESSNIEHQYYQLTFDYNFEYEDDEVWFATTVPYSFSQLWQFLKTLQNNELVTQEVLGKSTGGADIPLLTIKRNENLPFIVIGARVHPSETVGSYVAQGIIQFLLSDCQEANDLLERFIIKIVPMINPDGVVLGNSRTSMIGADINRTYLNPSKNIHAESYLVKKLVKKLQKVNKVKIFLDLHGHFCKKGAFVFGPYYPMHHDLYYKIRVIPKLLQERTSIFRFHSSRFAVDPGKKSCARVVIWKELNVPLVYTLETSYHGFIDDQRHTKPFETYDLFTLGSELMKAILDYDYMEIDEQSKVQDKVYQRMLKRQAMTGRRRTFDDLIAILRQDEAMNADSQSESSDSDHEYTIKKNQTKQIFVNAIRQYNEGIHNKRVISAEPKDDEVLPKLRSSTEKPNKFSKNLKRRMTQRFSNTDNKNNQQNRRRTPQYQLLESLDITQKLKRKNPNLPAYLNLSEKNSPTRTLRSVELRSINFANSLIPISSPEGKATIRPRRKFSKTNGIPI